MFKSISRHAFFRAFRHRSFSLLWSGQLLSRIGDFLYHIALSWWVLEVSGSATALATVLIVSFGPTILFTLIGGVAADRYPRLPIMIGSDVLRGATVLLVALLAMTGQLQLWHVYALSLFFGLVDAFFQPAYMATIPTFVPEADLPSANSLSSLAVQAGRIAGPPLGAALIALGGIGMAFAINGMTFLISAVFLLFIGQPRSQAIHQPTRQQKDRQTGQHIWDEFTVGIKSVRNQPWLRLSILTFALSNILLVGPYSVSLPFLVNDHLDSTISSKVATLGLLYALFAAGYVLGGIWLGRQERIRQHGRLIFGGLAVASVMLALFGLPIGIIGLGVAALINGAALEMGNLAWMNLLQERVPHDKLGRITSVDTVGSLALMPIGFAFAGWATEQLGAPLLFAVSGGTMALIALTALRHPAIYALDQGDPTGRHLVIASPLY